MSTTIWFIFPFTSADKSANTIILPCHTVIPHPPAVSQSALVSAIGPAVLQVRLKQYDTGLRHGFIGIPQRILYDRLVLALALAHSQRYAHPLQPILLGYEFSPVWFDQNLSGCEGLFIGLVFDLQGQYFFGPAELAGHAKVKFTFQVVLAFSGHDHRLGHFVISAKAGFMSLLGDSPFRGNDVYVVAEFMIMAHFPMIIKLCVQPISRTIGASFELWA
jgi:hypothetical protein